MSWVIAPIIKGFILVRKNHRIQLAWLVPLIRILRMEPVRFLMITRTIKRVITLTPKELRRLLLVNIPTRKDIKPRP